MMNLVQAVSAMSLIAICNTHAAEPINVADSGTKPARPNIVLILADDQGWGDLGFTGNINLSTPNIDSIAHEGASLKWFYVCLVCAPTRAEFLTGRYYPKTGVSGVSRGEGRLNVDETTIANVFRLAGYKTGAFGKWHNGTQPPYHPNDRGFDEFYGFTSGHWGHYSAHRWITIEDESKAEALLWMTLPTMPSTSSNPAKRLPSSATCRTTRPILQ